MPEGLGHRTARQRNQVSFGAFIELSGFQTLRPQMVKRSFEAIKDVPLPHAEHGPRMDLQRLSDQTIVQSLSVLIRLEKDASMRESAGGRVAHVDEFAQLLPLLVA